MKNGNASPRIFVVDDEPAVRAALVAVLDSVGLSARTFGSAEEYLTSVGPAAGGCLVLDIRLPGMSGLDLQARLAGSAGAPVIVFLSGFADVPLAVRALEGGASSFLEKPFRAQELLDRVHRALREDDDRRSERARTERLRERLDRLTAREREILDEVLTGLPNKAIAYDLGISERTVESHRASIMRKMEADSIATLVRLVLQSRGAAQPANSCSRAASQMAATAGWRTFRSAEIA